MTKVGRFAFFSVLVTGSILCRLVWLLPAAKGQEHEAQGLTIRPHQVEHRTARQGAVHHSGNGKTVQSHGVHAAAAVPHKAAVTAGQGVSAHQASSSHPPKVARLGDLPVGGEHGEFVMKTKRTAVLGFGRRLKDAVKLYWLPLTFGLVIAAFCVKSVIGCDCRCGRVCRCRCKCDSSCRCLRSEISKESHNSWMQGRDYGYIDAQDVADVAWAIFHHH